MVIGRSSSAIAARLGRISWYSRERSGRRTSRGPGDRRGPRRAGSGTGTGRPGTRTADPRAPVGARRKRIRRAGNRRHRPQRERLAGLGASYGVAWGCSGPGHSLALCHVSIRCRAGIAVSRAMAGEGVPGQRDHCVLRRAAMPAFRRVPARAPGGIQWQAAALDRPGHRERVAGRRGHRPLPVRSPALPGTGYSP